MQYVVTCATGKYL